MAVCKDWPQPLVTSRTRVTCPSIHEEEEGGESELPVGRDNDNKGSHAPLKKKKEQKKTLELVL